MRVWLPVRYLNVGGFGHPLHEEDTPSPLATTPLSRWRVREEMAAMVCPCPGAIEPGRSIVGKAGITAHRVGTIKEIPASDVYER